MSVAVEALPAAAKREGVAAINVRRILTHLAIFVVVIGTWELLGAMGQLNDLILPAPSAIGYAILQLYFVTGKIWWHFFVTMFEALAGFAIGAGIG
jgi:NitT/TauT family transport system permease protein